MCTAEEAGSEKSFKAAEEQHDKHFLSATSALCVCVCVSLWISQNAESAHTPSGSVCDSRLSLFVKHVSHTHTLADPVKCDSLYPSGDVLLPPYFLHFTHQV